MRLRLELNVKAFSSADMWSKLWIYLAAFIFLHTLKTMSLTTSKKVHFQEKDCPICFRVLRAVRDLSKSQELSMAEAFKKFCLVSSIEVEEQKFCYNLDPLHQELNRLFLLGADDSRICKKIFSVNADFCSAKGKKKDSSSENIVNRKSQRGIIYI